MSNAPFLTLFTPTFNRSDLLPRTYESIRRQRFRDFEWIIVDDGSTDDTPHLIARWKKEANFEIRAFSQPNSGRHIAIDRGVAEARAPLFMILDSDDWLVEDALLAAHDLWQAVPEDKMSNTAGLWALCAKPDGSLACTPYPSDVFDGNTIEIKSKHGFAGESCHLIRTDVRRLFPFADFGEKYCPPSLVWNRIAQEYEMRFVNRVLQYKEYQASGLTLAGDRKMRTSPLGIRQMNLELTETKVRFVSEDMRRKAMRRYVQASLHAGIGLGKQFREVKEKLLWLRCVNHGFRRYRQNTQ
ncbi:glycosyltransferase family 2 protein [Fulvimarina sp. MAC8]|uniref:glycosyltransferase family A protein n=1 Tax=Fulvimarina sp. MAC8 TaxID=3162874 RepID=UPI0032EB440C